MASPGSWTRRLVFSWCCLFAAEVSADEPQAALGQRLAEGQAAYQTHDYEKAEAIFRGILAREPEDFAANEFLGFVLSAQDKFTSATAYFAAAVRANPQSGAAHVNLATNLAQLNKDLDAEKEFRRALELNPSDYQANSNLGELYVRRGKSADAVAYLAEAQRLRPGVYSNGYDLALAEMMAGKITEAEQQIKVLLATSDTAELHGLLGAVYENQGKFELAASQLELAARLDPNESSIFDYGAEFLRHHTIEPAIQTFRQGIRLYPRSWKLRVGLALALDQHEENDHAIEEFCAAIDLAPSDPRTYTFLAGVAPESESAMKQALSRFEQYAKREPKNAYALYYYAVYVWKDSGENDSGDKVESLLRRAAELKPDLAEANLQLGIIYSRQGKHPAAAREYRLAIEKNPSMAPAHYRLGETLIREGERQAGRRELEIWKTLRTKQHRQDEQERARMLQFVYAAPQYADAKP